MKTTKFLILIITMVATNFVFANEEAGGTKENVKQVGSENNSVDKQKQGENAEEKKERAKEHKTTIMVAPSNKGSEHSLSKEGNVKGININKTKTIHVN